MLSLENSSFDLPGCHYALCGNTERGVWRCWQVLDAWAQALAEGSVKASPTAACEGNFGEMCPDLS